MTTRDDLRNLLARCRVTSGKKFRLADHATDEKGDLDLDKRSAEEWLRGGVERLSALHERLFTTDRWAVLCLFQAMDAGGKDGAIKHVFSGLNPAGCQVESFAAPSGVEKDHDFLWRHVLHLPQRGRIGIHNRSWYEEVLAARVHPEILQAQKLPPERVSKAIWDERLEDIAAFERYLGRQGVIVLKFFLHLGKEEQRQRFLARIDEPDKNWKLQPSDVRDRERWGDYQDAYEAAIRATATPEAPWFVVPADRKWLARLLVAEALLATLEALDLRAPEASAEQRAALREVRAALEADAPPA
ncbi:PPK2 family polyphosphate kinase [Roseomonas sp. BN140053]|uniref:PPK2 family polyphosphate kinase n=1 Tax=Roseomonas sp. BN140053 TaxID=3391898 RepID=UPI0039ED52FE